MNQAMKHKQRGLSVWGILGVILLALVVIWIAIKVVPEYIAASSVKSCLQDSYAGGGGNFAKIKSNFNQCLNMNAIYETGDYNLNMHGKTVTLDWEILLPIAGNASLLLQFEAQAPE
jgi:hypothetical protein